MSLAIARIFFVFPHPYFVLRRLYITNMQFSSNPRSSHVKKTRALFAFSLTLMRNGAVQQCTLKSYAFKALTPSNFMLFAAISLSALRIHLFDALTTSNSAFERYYNHPQDTIVSRLSRIIIYT